MGEIINVKEIVEGKKEKIKDKVQKLNKKGIYPKLAVILANNEEASKIYVGKKQKMCKELGIENIIDTLPTFKVAFGRSEVKHLNGKRVLIQLIKNPIGANEVLKTVDKESNILIIINDNYADGRDVSWLWDAEFEFLKNVDKEIVVSGIRANDMALRLKYAGVEKIKIINDIDKAVEYIGKSADNNITILPTYTALLHINKMKCLKGNR